MLVASLAMALSCTAPTLPLPPPAAPTVSVGSEPNTFHLESEKGGVIANALVIVVNRNESIPRDKRVTGTIADEEGAWELDVFGYEGDFVDISQEDGTTRSPATTIQLR